MEGGVREGELVLFAVGFVVYRSGVVHLFRPGDHSAATAPAAGHRGGGGVVG